MNTWGETHTHVNTWWETHTHVNPWWETHTHVNNRWETHTHVNTRSETHTHTHTHTHTATVHSVTTPALYPSLACTFSGIDQFPDSAGIIFHQNTYFKMATFPHTKKKNSQPNTNHSALQFHA